MPMTKRKRKAESPEEEVELKKVCVDKACINSEKIGEEEAENNKGKLSKFRISKATRKILKEKGIKFLFPIQYLTFDHIYDGKNVIGQARTGTGKTLSFVLPILERMAVEGSIRSGRGRPPCTLVMAPTRELANQVCEQFKMLSPFGVQVYCIYGGTRYEPQEMAMKRGIDILVGTPGRILDHMNRGNLNLTCLSHVVLDEADQMLERGFAENVEEILAASYREDNVSLPQMMLFSATIPSWVEETATRYMGKDRILVDLIGQQRVRTAVTVEHKAMCCPYQERPDVISDVIQVYSGIHGRTLVFTQTKRDADELAVSPCLSQEARVLHGDIVQKQRETTLKGFREGRFPLLIATDVAARGLDIPEVDLVIQCEPPKDVDAYIHRSGRTGRAGRTGVCVMFYKPREEYRIPQVEVKAGIQFQRIGAPQPSEIIKSAARDAIRSLDEIPASILPHFKEAAQDLIKERGAEDALAAALAQISGSKEIVSRSVLSGMSGFTSYLLSCDHEKRSAAYFWGVLERSLPMEVKAEVKGLRLCKDMKSVVFDLPNTIVSTVNENWEDGYMKLSQCSKLPELRDRPSDFYQKMKINDRGHVGGWRRGGSRGGRATGYYDRQQSIQKKSHSGFTRQKQYN